MTSARRAASRGGENLPYLGAVNRLIDKAVNVRADARESYQSYAAPTTSRATTTRKSSRSATPPRSRRFSNYNGMLSDLFALLTDARARIAANVKAIEAIRATSGSRARTSVPPSMAEAAAARSKPHNPRPSPTVAANIDVEGCHHD